MEKILTLHPDPNKKGVNIDLEKYNIMKETYFKVLTGGACMNHTDLMKAISFELDGRFEGSVFWYAEVLKLDLEARNLLRRSTEKPARYSLV